VSTTPLSMALCYVSLMFLEICKWIIYEHKKKLKHKKSNQIKWIGCNGAKKSITYIKMIDVMQSKIEVFSEWNETKWTSSDGINE